MTPAGGAGRGDRVQALLAAGLLAVTTLVRVPVEFYAATSQDFTAASQDLELVIFAAGLALFLVTACMAWLPGRARRHGVTALVGLAAFAWIRSGFFPGPSVTLDGGAIDVDLSTGFAGLLVPLTGGVLLAGLRARQARFVSTLLGVLLAGTLGRSLVVGVSAWNARPPASAAAIRSVLEWSRTENVLVLILDSLQSDVFEDVLEERSALRGQLDGFRYYRHASSSSPTTYLSVPTIHSGRVYEPGQSAADFFRDAIGAHSVLNRFVESGYRVSYASSVGTCPTAVVDCVGAPELARSRLMGAATDATRLLDLGLYRSLPDSLRRCILQRGRGPFGALARRAWLVGRADEGVAELERLASASTAIDSRPTAKMVHTMLTHPPFGLQADCTVAREGLDREAAVRQAACALRQVTALLEKLRAMGVYDVSSIVIAADHGYGLESRFAADVPDSRFRHRVGAFNPLVLVKPAGSRGALATSDAPLGLADLAGALCPAAGCSPAAGLRGLERIDPARSRLAFWYAWRHQYWNLTHIPGLIRYTVRGDILKPENWSSEAAAYSPGTVIDFRRGQNSGPYRAFGWGRPQPTFTLMTAATGTARLQARFEADRDYELLIEAQVGGVGRSTTRLSVEVNGARVGELRREGNDDELFRSYRFLVPAGVLARSAETAIAISADEANLAAGGTREEGPYGALRSLELRPRR